MLSPLLGLLPSLGSSLFDAVSLLTVLVAAAAAGVEEVVCAVRASCYLDTALPLALFTTIVVAA